MNFTGERSLLDDQCLFTLLLAWMISSTLLKFGILLFYWRLFPNKHFRWSIYAVAVFVSVCFVAGFVGFTLQCTPVRGFWRPLIPHTCVDQYKLYIATATLGLIGDVILLIQPIPVVWRLNTTRQRRIGLCIVFLLGGLYVFYADRTNLINTTKAFPLAFV